MVFMRIHCGACGGQWEVYTRQRDTAAARICPHCEHRIDGETWAGKILPAFQAVGAANMALAFDSTEKHTAEYSIDFIADGKFQNANKADIMNEIYGLQESICDIQKALKSIKRSKRT